MQAVLLTDGTQTMVIIHYKQLTWQAGPLYGGQADTGLVTTHHHYPLVSG